MRAHRLQELFDKGADICSLAHGDNAAVNAHLASCLRICHCNVRQVGSKQQIDAFSYGGERLTVLEGLSHKMERLAMLHQRLDALLAAWDEHGIVHHGSDSAQAPVDVHILPLSASDHAKKLRHDVRLHP